MQKFSFVFIAKACYSSVIVILYVNQFIDNKDCFFTSGFMLIWHMITNDAKWEFLLIVVKWKKKYIILRFWFLWKINLRVFKLSLSITVGKTNLLIHATNYKDNFKTLRYIFQVSKIRSCHLRQKNLMPDPDYTNFIGFNRNKKLKIWLKMLTLIMINFNLFVSE